MSQSLDVWLGAALTLMVFSYLLGDNPAFRFSIHLFVGVTAGLVGAVALRNVILPYILLPLLDLSDFTGWLWSLGLLLLSVLLLLKLAPRFGRLGSAGKLCGLTRPGFTSLHRNMGQLYRTVLLRPAERNRQYSR